MIARTGKSFEDVAVGKVYTKLTVVSRAAKIKGFQYWNCICTCGAQKIIVAGSLKSGATKSCGCYKKICRVTHGMSDTEEYYTWENMIARCRGTTAQMKKDYVDRGITVCESWRKFENFFADMGLRPANMTLDRIDNNKGYYKDNCEWVDHSAQQYNRRR